jgi:hypothetical protein
MRAEVLTVSDETATSSHASVSVKPARSPASRSARVCGVNLLALTLDPVFVAEARASDCWRHVDVPSKKGKPALAGRASGDAADTSAAGVDASSRCSRRRQGPMRVP